MDHRLKKLKRLRFAGIAITLLLAANSCSDKSVDVPVAGVVSGTVFLENTGGTIPKVVITVAGRSFKTVTNGRFEIPEVPLGEQTITATKGGYEDYAARVTVTSRTIHDIHLTRITAP